MVVLFLLLVLLLLLPLANPVSTAPPLLTNSPLRYQQTPALRHVEFDAPADWLADARYTGGVQSGVLARLLYDTPANGTALAERMLADDRVAWIGTRETLGTTGLCSLAEATGWTFAAAAAARTKGAASASQLTPEVVRAIATRDTEEVVWYERLWAAQVQAMQLDPDRFMCLHAAPSTADANAPKPAYETHDVAAICTALGHSGRVGVGTRAGGWAAVACGAAVLLALGETWRRRGRRVDSRRRKSSLGAYTAVRTTGG